MKQPYIIFITILWLPSLFLTSITGCAMERKEEDIEQLLSFGSGGRLTLKNLNGAIRVDSWDKNEVKVQAKKKASGSSREEVEDLLSRTKIRIDPTPNQIDIRTELPENGSLGTGKNIRVDYRLTVPKSINLELKSVNGGIQVSSISGSVDVRSTNGGIEVSEVQDKVHAEAKNGGIKLVKVRGKVKAKTTNGGIDVEILEQSREGIHAYTTNGDIKLALPEGFKAHLKANTKNGNIKTDFPVQVEGRFSKSAEGDLNGGGPDIRLETTNGSIQVLEY